MFTHQINLAIRRLRNFFTNKYHIFAYLFIQVET